MLYAQVKQEIIKRCYIHKKFAINLQKIQGDKLIMIVTVGKKKKNVNDRFRLKLIIPCHS